MMAAHLQPRCKKLGCRYRAHPDPPTRPDGTRWDGYCCGACEEGYAPKGDGVCHGKMCLGLRFEQKEVGILSVGTRGDMQPVLALAIALVNSGFRVTLFGTSDFAEWAASYRISFVTVVPDSYEKNMIDNYRWMERAADQAGAIFQYADQDGDGLLSHGELTDLLLTLGKPEGTYIPWEFLCSIFHCDPALGISRDAFVRASLSSPDLDKDYHTLREKLPGKVPGLATHEELGEKPLGAVFEFIAKNFQFHVFMEALRKRKPDLLLWWGTFPIEGAVYAAEKLYSIKTMNLIFQPLTPPDDYEEHRKQQKDGYDALCGWEDNAVKPFYSIAPLRDMSFDDYWRRSQVGGIVPYPAVFTDSALIDALAPGGWQRKLGLLVKNRPCTGLLFMDDALASGGTSSQQLIDQDPEHFGGSSMLALNSFLAQGPCAYIGWGSMTSVGRGKKHLIKLAVSAVKGAGIRAVLLRGWAGLSLGVLKTAVGEDDPEELCSYAEEHVMFVDKVSHSWLFPKCSCAVHHGGLGTTGAALRAGVPMVVTPVGADQFDNAKFVEALGVGVGFSMSIDDVSPAQLASALKRVVTEPVFRVKAKEAQQSVEQENGVAKAIEFITRALQGV